MHGQVLIDTLNQYPWSTPSMDSQPAPPLTINEHLMNISVDSQSKVNKFSQTHHCMLIIPISQSTLCRLSTNCQMSVDQDMERVSTKYWLRFLSRLIESTDWHWSMDALSTLDPRYNSKLAASRWSVFATPLIQMKRLKMLIVSLRGMKDSGLTCWWHYF